MTESVLRKFFDQSHTILGLDNDAARAEAWDNFQGWILKSCEEQLLKDADTLHRQQYESFMNRQPKPSPADVVMFWQSLRPAVDLKQLLANSVKDAARNYMAQLLERASPEQKVKIQSASGILVQSVVSSE